MEGKIISSVPMQDDSSTAVPKCAAALSPDSAFAVICSGGDSFATVLPLPPREGKQIRVRGHEGYVRAVDWSHGNAPAVVSSGTDGIVRVTYLAKF